MKVLRSTMWASPDMPVTVVVRECDLRATIADAVMELVSDKALVIADVFDVADEHTYGDPVRVALAGEERAAAARDVERNMAIAYHWWATALMRTTHHGIIQSTKRAPLTVEQLETVLSQLSINEHYLQQTIVAFADDGTTVKLSDGKVRH